MPPIVRAIALALGHSWCAKGRSCRIIANRRAGFPSDASEQDLVSSALVEHSPPGSAGGTAEWSVYTLAPRSAFNFGPRAYGAQRRLGLFPSDSLFSALCTQLRELRGRSALERLLDEFIAGDPPFLVSGLFPRLGPVQLLPRPATPPAAYGAAAAGRLDYRTFTQLEWLSWSVFERWVGGTMGADGAPAAAQGGTIRLAADEYRQAADAQALIRQGPAGGAIAWQHGQRVRTVTGRDGRGVRAYTRSTTSFAPGTRLSLFIAWRRDDWREVLEQTLAALGDGGLGADRGVGHGYFALERAETRPAPQLPDADGLVTFALLCPTRPELAAGLLTQRATAWTLVERGGRAGSPEAAGQRRRRVTMLAAGSVVASPADSGEGWIGQLVDVTPDPAPGHRVWRYGFAFGWPLRLPTAAVPPDVGTPHAAPVDDAPACATLDEETE